MTNVWDELDKGMIHALGEIELEGMRSHHTTQNGTQCKTYELFISGMLHLIVYDWLTGGN